MYIPQVAVIVASAELHHSKLKMITKYILQTFIVNICQHKYHQVTSIP